MIRCHNPMAFKTWSERRQSPERRGFSPATIIYGCVYSRRRSPRRGHDQNGYYTDWYESWLLYTIMGILLLSSTDAMLTLKLLELGGMELNPFMAVLIDTDVRLFIIIKVALTGISLIFLVMHTHFRLLRLLKVSHALQAILFGYLLLIAYELTLLLG